MIRNKTLKIGLVMMVLSAMMFSALQVNIKAAIFGISASNNGNGTTTVVVSGDCAGSFSITVAGQTQNIFKEKNPNSGTFSNASATFNVGAGSFTATATAIDVSDASYAAVSGSVSTSVTVTNGPTGGGSAPSGGGGSASGGSSNGGATGGATDTPVEENKTANIALATLSVSAGELNPAFSPDVLNYRVELPKSARSIDVAATVAATGVSVDGAGTYKLKNGDNPITLTTKAVEGAETRTYNINVYVEEVPNVFLSGTGEKKLGIISATRAPALEGFEDYTLKVGGKDVLGKRNPNSKLVLLYMSNSKDEKNFYIYDEKKKEVTSIYVPITLFEKKYAIITVPEEMKKMAGLENKKITIDGKSFDGWSFKNKEFKNYSLIYLMDTNAQAHLYQYESTSNTIQLYSGAAATTQTDYDKAVERLILYKTLTYVFIATSIIMSGISVAFLLKAKAVKKIKI